MFNSTKIGGTSVVIVFLMTGMLTAMPMAKAGSPSLPASTSESTTKTASLTLSLEGGAAVGTGWYWALTIYAPLSELMVVHTADIVLIKNDPRDVAKLAALSRKTMRKMNEKLVWAAGYNVIAIPVAAGVLVPFGIVLPPEVAAITMTLSSISVTVNALLRRAKL